MSDVSPTTEREEPADAPVDLAAAERDLAAVEAALQRLDAGTYWTDEVTGAAIPDDVLAADPLTRRVPTPGNDAPAQFPTPGNGAPAL